MDEYAFLSYDAISWILRFLDLIFFVYIFGPLQQDNPTFRGWGAITGKENRSQMVSCKVNQIGFTIVVLKLAHDFKIVFTGLVDVVFSCFQNFCLKELYIKYYLRNFSPIFTPKA